MMVLLMKRSNNRLTQKQLDKQSATIRRKTTGATTPEQERANKQRWSNLLKEIKAEITDHRRNRL